MSLLDQTKSRMEELNISPKRSMGQNFLISEHVVDKIIARVESLNPSHLIEIGPGLGALTDRLRKVSCPLRLIELDRALAQYWRNQGLDVVEDDALKVKWSHLQLPAGSVLVSNLPYQISTHLVVDRCLEPAGVSHMVLMFQKEVAERLRARPRTPAYGLLSPMAQTFWKIDKLLEAAPRAFWPVPNVASQVLVFSRQPSPLPGWEFHFLQLLKGAFSHRRKFLIKNLSQMSGKFRVNEKDWPVLFERLGIGAKVRAEELSPERYIELARKLKDRI